MRLRRAVNVSIRSKLSSRPVQTTFGLVAAAILLWLFFRGTDLAAIRESLAGARLSLILAAVAMTLLGYLLRAMRWKVLLAPLGSAALWNCFVATAIGFMVNSLVPPGRLGEIARPYVLARKEGFSASSAFATIFLERVLDLVTVVLLIGLSLLVARLPSSSEDVVRGLKIGGALGLAGSATALAVMFVVARHRERTLSVAERWCRLFPARISVVVMRFLETFVAGLAVLVDTARFLKATVLSLVLWATIAGAFYFGALALGVRFPYGDTFLVIGFLTVGVAVPTPGAVGGYHYMCALALTTLFATEPSVAKAVALVNHAIAFLPVTVIGIFLFPKAGASFRQLKTISSERGEEQPA